MLKLKFICWVPYVEEVPEVFGPRKIIQSLHIKIYPFLSLQSSFVAWPS